MSTEIITSTNNFLSANRDTSKIFLWNKQSDKATYTNGTGADVTLAAGTLIGRITSNAKVAPMESNASDGSQKPIGILMHDVSVGDGEDAVLTYCTGGDVAQGKLVFTRVGDSLTTAVDGEIIRDILQNKGINLVGSDELTAFDN